jgi:hydrogenase nickel incorporation protein HypA/HybF
VHELGIARQVVAAAAEHAAGGQVRVVHLVVGRLAGVSVDSVQFGFDHAAAGTPVEGARLVVRQEPGMAECRACGRRFETDELVPACACGSLDVAVVGGREVLVEAVELAEPGR